MLGASFFSVNAPLSLRRPLPRCNHPPIFDASKRIVSSTFARLDRNWSPQITLDARSMRRKERLRDRKGARNEASKSTERGAACRVFFFFGPACGRQFHVFASPFLFSLSLSPHYYLLTATLRAAREGTLSSVEWRYRSTVALAASTAVGASEAMPTTASSAASAAKRADDETILFSFSRVVNQTRCGPEKVQSNDADRRIIKRSIYLRELK